MRVCFDRQSEEYLQKYRTFSILMIRKSEEWWWCKTFMMVWSLHITHDELCNLLQGQVADHLSSWGIRTIAKVNCLTVDTPDNFSTIFTITATFLSDLPVASSEESLRESLLHFRWPAKAFACWFQMTESEQSLLLCLIYVLAQIVHMANLPRFWSSMPLPFLLIPKQQDATCRHSKCVSIPLYFPIEKLQLLQKNLQRFEASHHRNF